MGTRHITAVKCNGEYIVAQYGQWDGYPSGAGANILKFLKQADFGQFLSRLKNVRFMAHDELEDLWVKAGAERGADGVSMEVSDRFNQLYPSLHRNTGSNILDIIYNSSDTVLLRNEIEFIADGLFCEWAYVIDMDSFTFEVYKGFNSIPLQDGDRFKFLEDLSRNGYKPPKLAISISFEALPDSDFIFEAIEQ